VTIRASIESHNTATEVAAAVMSSARRKAADSCREVRRSVVGTFPPRN
jgi:hypothetical protein